MIYDNTDVRRQDRLLDESLALRLLQSMEYGVLSMTDRKGTVYGIPMNFVWDGRNSIYLHCAPEGRKLNYIKHNKNVSFCIVGETNVLPDKFSTLYESIVLECTAHVNLSEEEKMNALMLLVGKYSPGYRETGRKYAEGSFARTEIIRLDIGKWSGKSKKIF